jgi:hypothetical protein
MRRNTMGSELSTTKASDLDPAILFSLVTGGDCAKLNDNQKLAYYKARCEAAGIDPRCQPFQFLNLQGKVVLYALKGATDQLASKHGIKVEIASQVTEAGIRTVTVRATAKDGRQTDEIGAVSVEGVKGDQLCNAYMKAVTKAKRRAVLSLCGLGMMDETEIETVPNAVPLVVPIIEHPAPPPTPAPVGVATPKPTPQVTQQVETKKAEPQELESSVYVVEAVSKNGKQDKKGHTYWGILLKAPGATDEGQWANTYHERFYEVAKAAKKSGKRFLCSYNVSGGEGRVFWWLEEMVEVKDE